VPVGLLKKYHLRENSHANPFVFNGHFSRDRVFQQPSCPRFSDFFRISLPSDGILNKDLGLGVIGLFGAHVISCRIQDTRPDPEPPLYFNNSSFTPGISF
jgi:hypothetical protein